MADERDGGGRVALVVVDVINDLGFPGGEQVLPWARTIVESTWLR